MKINVVGKIRWLFQAAKIAVFESKSFASVECQTEFIVESVRLDKFQNIEGLDAVPHKLQDKTVAIFPMFDRCISTHYFCVVIGNRKS